MPMTLDADFQRPVLGILWEETEMLSKILTASLFLVVVVAIAFQANPAEAAGVVTNGLVSYWTFDRADVDGDTVKDVNGGNDGTINGAATIVMGKVREGIELNGTDQFVEIPHDDSLVPLEAFTVEAWFNTELKDKALWQSIVSKNAPGNRSYELRLQPDPHFLVPSWAVVDAAGTFIRANAPDDEEFETDRWYHIAGIWDGKSDEAHLYVDGKLKSSVEATSIWPSTISLFIGKRPQNGGKNFFKGIIDEVRIYDRVLTKAEVNRNMEATAVEPSEKLASKWGDIKGN